MTSHHSVMSILSHAPRSESRAESISTLWSSADVPLFFDSKRESSSNDGYGAGPSKVFMSTPKGFSAGLPSLSIHNSASIDDDEEETEEMTSDFIDGPRSVSSPPSSDYSSDSNIQISPSHPRKQRKASPPHLNLAPPGREASTSRIPVSVSHASHLTFKSEKSVESQSTVMMNNLSPRTPSANLYEEAEKYFSKSYSMSPETPSSPLPPPTPRNTSRDRVRTVPRHVLQSRFSDADTEDGNNMMHVAALQEISRSRDSKSSAESSLIPDFDDSNSHSQTTPTSFASSTMSKHTNYDAAPSSPLRSAIGMATNHPIVARPYTSDSTSIASPTKVRPEIRHIHTTSDQEIARLNKQAEEQNKYDFLQSPAPTPNSKKLSLFGSKTKAISTPRLRSVKAAEGGLTTPTETVTSPTESCKDQQREGRLYPPQSPSGRYRSRTLGESERPDLANDVQRFNAPQSDDVRRSLRRPSSSDALSAAARRLRRPSKATTVSSSHYDSSVVSINNESDFYETAKSSSTSSQLNLETSSRSGSQTRKSTLRAQSSSGNVSNRPKSKGGWASHLTQGLTLHLEQGSRKYTIKMNYLSYDPFGKPESLCVSEGRPLTPKRPKSKGGKDEKEVSTPDESVGILEFGPSGDQSGSSSPTQLTMKSSLEDESSPTLLKHVVIGDDIRGDLITRQANLSLCNVGTREVSGSERKGKVTWRFVYGVEECWNGAGQVLEGIKTLRPISFFCSGTLLDPAKAKKFKVINMIRKQIGSHIESMPMAGSVANYSYDSLPKVESPTSSKSSNTNNSTSPRQKSNNIIMASTLPAAAAVPRPGLVPFKMSRPMMEAMQARNRNTSEQATNNQQINSKSNLLPSPLSSHFITTPTAIQEDRSPAAKSARELQPSSRSRLLSPQTAVRARGNSVGQNSAVAHRGLGEGAGALGLDTNEPKSRRIRAVTTNVDLTRPPTASEEIKQAYLKQKSQLEQVLPQQEQRRNFDDNISGISLHSSQRNHLYTFQQSIQQQHHHYHQHQSSSSSHHQQEYPRRPSTSQVDTRAREREVTPTTSFQRYNPIRSNNNSNNINNFEAPEGPYWL